MTLFEAYAAGLLGILVFVVVFGFVVSSQPKNTLGDKILAVVSGEDGRLSTSKFQWFVWTIAVVGGFAAVFAALGLKGYTATDLGVPSNILIALGFSTVTVATAKGITVSYIAGGRVTKSSNTSGSVQGGVLVDDKGIADLSKIQLITWTIIAIGIWIYLVARNLNDIVNGSLPDKNALALPDIPAALMVLTGLSQGGYLGHKLVSVDPSFSVNALVPSTARPADIVQLFGNGFKSATDKPNLTQRDNSFVLVGGIQAKTSWWSDTLIRFQVPDVSPDGNNWSGTESAVVTIVIDGQQPDNVQFPTLTIVAPPAQGRT